MVGLDYQSRLNQLLSESVGSYWVDKKTGFDFLFEAAKDFAKEVKSIHDTQTITTVAGTLDYRLKPNFMEILTQDGYGNKIVPLDNSGERSWLKRVGYGKILYENTTTPSTPTEFAITDAPVDSRITGTTTSAGVSSGGESILTDASASFITTVNIGDSVVNPTSGKYYVGTVLSVSSNTALVTAMFNISSSQSSYASWGIGDTYYIEPHASYTLVISPPPSTTGTTITLSYLCFPNPVYSDYGSYSFATGYEEALLKYAVWLYKYRDTKANQGDALYRYYDQQLRKAKNIHKSATTPPGFKISFIKR
jgi:hypothetical protein